MKEDKYKSNSPETPDSLKVVIAKNATPSLERAPFIFFRTISNINSTIRCSALFLQEKEQEKVKEDVRGEE